MNCFSKFFLVLLRLAIGWHFLVEGVGKLETYYHGETQRGPTETVKPFTSVGYLRQATGPFRDFIAREVGDADHDALARLDPAAIEKSWRDYYQQFSDHYGLSADQKKRTDPAFEGHLKNLLQGKQEVKNVYPGRTVPLEETLAQRLAEYRSKLDDVHQREEQELQAFNHDVEGERLRSAKADVSRIRAELLALVKDQTGAMQKDLDGVLTPDQKAKGALPVSEPVPTPKAHWLTWNDETWLRWLGAWGALLLGAGLFFSCLGNILAYWRRRDELGGFGKTLSYGATLVGLALMVTAAVYIGTNWKEYSRIEWMDWLASWGLAMVGVGLLVGFLTRSACLGGALFLLALYLAMPPWPWLPGNPKTEGNYLIVNKNLIEMLALLALATTHSGRWFGLDGVLQLFNPWRWRRVRVQTNPEADRRLRHAVNV